MDVIKNKSKDWDKEGKSLKVGGIVVLTGRLIGNSAGWMVVWLLDNKAIHALFSAPLWRNKPKELHTDPSALLARL